MGKKATWFSAIKTLFTCYKQPLNVLQEGEKKSWKEKKGRGKGLGRFKHGIPLFREPSSIEKILGEIDQHNLITSTGHHPQPQPQPPQPPPPPPPHQSSSSSSSSRPVSPPNVVETVIHKPEPSLQKQLHRPEPSLQKQHLSATRIQAVYRGYMVRRNIRGLVRLRKVINSRSVKRQRVNAMKQMQLLVRVQTQVHSGRTQSQTVTPQSNNNNSPNKQSEMGEEYWDDSLITKEEREARLKRKAEAAINRERAMSYAYSHQKQKASAHHQTSLMGGVGSGYNYPWWWNRAQPPPKNQTTSYGSTPPRRTHKQLDSPNRPMSSRSMVSSSSRYSKARSRYPLKDDASLMSCPPFSVPNYMSPTASARAKAKYPTTPGSETSKRRFSFPFTPNKSPGSIGGLSIDSATSVPSSIGRKPFNRFV